MNIRNWLCIVSLTLVSCAVALGQPGVWTGGATDITKSSAVIKGSVDPNYARTTVYFEFGKTGSYGSVTEADTIDPPGYAVVFPGSSQYGEILDTSQCVSYTYEMWVRPDYYYDMGIFIRTNFHGYWGGAYSPLLYTTTDHRFAYYTWDGSGHTIVSATTYTTGQWYHVAIIAQQNGYARLFVNGREEGTPQAIGTVWQGGDRYWLSNSYNYMYGGCVDELRYWNVALDGATIRRWMGRNVDSNHPNYSALRGYWRFNEGSGLTVNDASGYGHNLALINYGSPWIDGARGFAVSADLSGLDPTTTYYYRVTASNGSGTSYGGQQSFATRGIPVIHSNPASYSENLYAGDTKVDSLFVANTGTETLNYTLSTVAPLLVPKQRPHTLVHAGFVGFSSSGGALAVGAVDTVLVTFDPSGYSAGTYRDTIYISSDDPVNSLVKVPVEMSVTDAAGLSVTPSSLAFGGVFVGSSKTASLKVVNNGTTTLNVTNVISNRTQFVPIDSMFTVGPSGSHDLRITFTPVDSVNVSAAIVIENNDPTNSHDTVNVSGRGCFRPSNAGYALRFDGTNDYVRTQLNDLSGDQLTIEYWFKGSSLQSAVRQQDDFNYIVAGWSGIHILSVDGGTSSGVSVGGAATDGNWHHVAMTWQRNSSNGFTSYLDGSIVNQRASADVSIPVISDDVLFGSFHGSSEWTNGVLDEIRIWKVARTQQQIRENMHRQVNTADPDLLGYWEFDEGGGTTTVDHAQSKDATLNNFDMTSSSGWVQSTIPLGSGTSTTHSSVTSGSWDFGGLTISTAADTFDNPIDLCVTQINTAPNLLPSGSSTYLQDRYWVVNFFGTPGSFSVSMKFTVPGTFTNNGSANSALYTLYARSDNCDTGWTPLIVGASAITGTSLTFTGITSFSQFMIGTNDALPIQLASLSAVDSADGVTLEWSTVSEVNTYGFYVERRPDSSQLYTTVSGLIPGAGTTLEEHHYKWTDESVSKGSYVYRLKQVDLNGAFGYSHEIRVDVVLDVKTKPVPRVFSLKQNYPNPFNPSTFIHYEIPVASTVRLEIFNTLGQSTAILVNAQQEAGYYDVSWQPAKPSGMYFYRLSATGLDDPKKSFVQVKKMLLLK
jgi:hypothetical protein